MSKQFNYKEGEDYTCVLCGETKHTTGPRPDSLCDGCWELKHRIEDQPGLAYKVLMRIPRYESFDFLGKSVVIQGPEDTLNILNYEQGALAKCYLYYKRYGPQGYLPNVKVEAADVLSTIRMFFEHMGWSEEEIRRLGEEHYLERQEDLKKHALNDQLKPEFRRPK